MQFTQVIPVSGSSVSGVADYARHLEAAWREMGLHSQIVEARIEGDLQSGQGRALALEKQLELSEATTVLLHFSGYGYARWGLCWWLASALERWKHGKSRRAVVTLFHEVFATGPIWRASFWSSYPQQRIAARIARLSSSIVSTSEGGANQLRGLYRGAAMLRVPVFSNVGEPKQPLPLRGRSPLAVVFGTERPRDRVYQALRRPGAKTIDELHRRGITALIDIGPGNLAPDRIGELPVDRLGVLNSSSVSDRLASSRIGLLDYEAGFLEKSGIFAAYTAHGMLVVTTSDTSGLPKEILDGAHLVSAGRLERSASCAQGIADAAHAWYNRHSREEVAKILAHALLAARC